jgi:Haem-binding domain
MNKFTTSNSMTMKKLLPVALVLVSMFFISGLIFAPLAILSAPTSEGGGTPIPDGIMKIAQKSCVKCHTEPGNFMAMSHLNFSDWDKYPPQKQVSKAKEMCNMVSKDKMPPKKFRENNPTAVPTIEEANMICNWSQSLEPVKK